MITHWYAVYTKPRWEKKIAEALTKKNFENYCPLNKVERQWHDRKKTVHLPLFSSYVFVRMREDRHSEIRKIDGIINLVHWLRRPAVIRDEEIVVIKKFLNDYSNVHLEKAPVNINDTVKIIGGPLMEMEGNVLSVKNKKVKVVLPSLGYLLVAEVEKHNIEIIRSAFSNLIPDAISK